MLRGRTAKARPFVPFRAYGTGFERTFTGGKGDPKMVLTPIEGEEYQRSYAPTDRSGPPKEVVKVEVSFTLNDEALFLEYDTETLVLPNGETEYIEGDEKHMIRTLNHRVPILSAKWQGGKGKLNTLPTDWMELLGRQCFVKVVFVEEIPDRPSLFWNGKARMESFELSWRINLGEWCASPEVQKIWARRTG